MMTNKSKSAINNSAHISFSSPFVLGRWFLPAALFYYAHKMSKIDKRLD